MRLIKSSMLRVAGHVACITGIMNAYKITYIKPERCRLNATKLPVYVIMNIIMNHWIS